LVNGTLTPGDLVRLPQALTIRDRQSGDDEVAQAAVAEEAREAVVRALVDLDAMRTREGEHLRADLDVRRGVGAGRAAMELRVAERVREMRTELQADENAVAQEILRMAARSDIREEVTRFRVHVSHWGALGERPDA